MICLAFENVIRSYAETEPLQIAQVVADDWDCDQDCDQQKVLMSTRFFEAIEPEAGGFKEALQG